MQESTSPNYRYLKYTTMVLFAAGMAGAFLLLRRIPVRGDVFWPGFAGLEQIPPRSVFETFTAVTHVIS
jgi:hypothetical protein